MPVKALAISLVAALVGPTIGVGVFLLADGDRWGGETASIPTRAAGSVTEFGQAQERTFAAPRLWPGPMLTDAPERRAKTLLAQPSPELAPWRTVVSCPAGDTLLETGHCPSLEWPPAEVSAASNIAAREPDAAERTPSPLPGRMSLTKGP